MVAEPARCGRASMSPTPAMGQVGANSLCRATYCTEPEACRAMQQIALASGAGLGTGMPHVARC
jgi:hypothetical protein